MHSIPTTGYNLGDILLEKDLVPTLLLLLLQMLKKRLRR